MTAAAAAAATAAATAAAVIVASAGIVVVVAAAGEPAGLDRRGAVRRAADEHGGTGAPHANAQKSRRESSTKPDARLIGAY